MKKMLLGLTLIFLGSIVIGQTEATTKDGRKVILNTDGTYKFVDTETKTIDSTAKTTLSDDEFFIGRHVDDMTDKVTLYGSKRLVIRDPEDSKMAFAVYYSFKGTGANDVKISGINVKIVGMTCVENVALLFLFDDGSKLQIKSWNKFNCKGNAWYTVSLKQLNILATKKIKKIRVQDGKSYKTITKELDAPDKSYFINMAKALKDKKVINKQLK
tara:strand:- start:8 stop:652 length:645 start_codon:yes stop_codon:yes gene_type:complete